MNDTQQDKHDEFTCEWYWPRLSMLGGIAGIGLVASVPGVSPLQTICGGVVAAGLGGLLLDLAFTLRQQYELGVCVRNRLASWAWLVLAVTAFAVAWPWGSSTAWFSAAIAGIFGSLAGAAWIIRIQAGVLEAQPMDVTARRLATAFRRSWVIRRASADQVQARPARQLYHAASLIPD